MHEAVFVATLYLIEIESFVLTPPPLKLSEPLSEELVVERLCIERQDEESVDELLFLDVNGAPVGNIS